MDSRFPRRSAPVPLVMIRRAHFYTGISRMCVLRYCIPNKGLHPLRCESGYPLKEKGVTFDMYPVFWTPSFELNN